MLSRDLRWQSQDAGQAYQKHTRAALPNMQVMLCNVSLTLAEVGTLKGVPRVKVVSTAEELPGHMPYKQAPTALTLQTGPAEHSIIAVTHGRSRALGCLSGRHQELAVR